MKALSSTWIILSLFILMITACGGGGGSSSVSDGTGTLSLTFLQIFLARQALQCVVCQKVFGEKLDRGFLGVDKT